MAMFAAGFLPPKNINYQPKIASNKTTPSPKKTPKADQLAISASNEVENHQTTSTDINVIANMLKADGYTLSDVNNSREFESLFYSSSASELIT